MTDNNAPPRWVSRLVFVLVVLGVLFALKPLYDNYQFLDDASFRGYFVAHPEKRQRAIDICKRLKQGQIAAISFNGIYSYHEAEDVCVAANDPSD